MFFTVLLAGCATLGESRSPLGEESVRYGLVADVALVTIADDQQLGMSDILVASASGLVGHPFGAGSCRNGDTNAGATGGRPAGNEIQNRLADLRAGQKFLVCLDSGASVSVTQFAGAGVHVGDHVRVEGNAHAARVVRS